MNWTDLAWITRESELKQLVDIACEAEKTATTPMQKDRAYAEWQEAVAALTQHKKTMPGRVEAAREAARLKAARAQRQRQPELTR